MARDKLHANDVRRRSNARHLTRPGPSQVVLQYIGLLDQVNVVGTCVSQSLSQCGCRNITDLLLVLLAFIAYYCRRQACLSLDARAARPSTTRLLKSAHGFPIQSIKNKVHTDIAVRSLTCHTATGTHMPYRITQCYLPPDRADIPVFTPAKAGTRLSDPGGMQG